MSYESNPSSDAGERSRLEHSPADQRIQAHLSERAKGFHAPLNAALIALLGITNTSGISHADVEEARERQEEFSSPAAQHRVRAERTRENLGPQIQARMAETAPYDGMYAANRARIEHREQRHGYVQGFEGTGFSNEGIEKVLNRVMPPEWLSEENLASISVSDAPPDSMEHYHMSGHAAAHCVRAREGQALTRGHGRVEVFRSWLQSTAAQPAEYRAKVFVYTLIHEIGHANDQDFSITMAQNQREEVYDWLGVRVRNMEENHYVDATTRSHHLLNQAENETRRWLGNRYAFPTPGEGSLPILYPEAMHANTSLEERNQRRVEYYAETAAIVATVSLPDEAYASDETWEIFAAQSVLNYDYYFHRIGLERERGEHEQADALEHVRLMRRLIPDIRTRNQAYHQLVQSGELVQLLTAH